MQQRVQVLAFAVRGGRSHGVEELLEDHVQAIARVAANGLRKLLRDQALVPAHDIDHARGEPRHPRISQRLALFEPHTSAVRQAHAGETLLPRSVIVGIAQRVLAARDRDADRVQIEPLTPRELEVLKALTEGLSTPDICNRLFIAPNTLRTHVRNIMSKLRVHSKLEAVAFAIRHRLVEPPRPEGSLY